MISASQDFITAVEGNHRTFSAKIYSGGSEVACNIISIIATKGAQDGQTFTVGSVFSSSVEITCANLSAALENEDIELKIGVLKSNGTYDYITYGKYTVIRAQRSTHLAVLTCVGFISSKFNVMLPDMTTPTVANVASAIQTATGITVSFVGISSGTSNSLAKDLKDVTCRAALSIIAFAVGGFATENSTGGVEIHQFTATSTYSLSSGRCLLPPVVSEDSFEMTGIKVIIDPGAYVLTQDTSVVSGKTYYMRTGSGTSADPYVYTEVEDPTGNPSSQGWYEIKEISYETNTTVRQTYQNEYVTQSVFNTLSSALVGLEFDPAEIDMSLGDPRIEPWDCMTVTDVDGTTTHTVPCHLIQSTFDGGFASKILSIGEGETDKEVTGALTDQVRQAVSDLAVTQSAADQAKAAATQAKTYAEQAKETTDEINAYAETAGKTVTQILQDGETAGAMADSAQQSATNAYNSASQAIDQLSVVEDIVGVLNLVADNGVYALTTDTEIQQDKWYFEVEGTAVTDPTGNPHEQGWYELSSGVYSLTDDTTVTSGKTYYTLTASIVNQPVVADIGTYYQLVSIDQSIQNYVADHIVYAGGTLSLKNGDTRIQLSTDASQGLTFYNGGQQVARYGTDAIIGDPNGVHIVLTTSHYDEVINPTGNPNEQGWYELSNGVYVLTEDTTVISGKTYYMKRPRLSFYMNSTTEVAYISGDRLYISQTVVLQQMDVGKPVVDGGFGQWSWKVHEVNGANNLYLKWLG